MVGNWECQSEAIVLRINEIIYWPAPKNPRERPSGMKFIEQMNY